MIAVAVVLLGLVAGNRPEHAFIAAAIADDTPPTWTEPTMQVVGTAIHDCAAGEIPIYTRDAEMLLGCLGASGFGGFGGGASSGPLVGGGGASAPSNTDPTADKNKDKNDRCANPTGKLPIQTSHMAETLALTLFKLPGEMGLSYSLYYVSPRGWFDSLDYWLDTQCGPGLPIAGGDPIRIDPDPPSCDRITFHRPDGSSIVFSGSPGTAGDYPAQGGSRASLTGNADGTYTLQDENGATLTFAGRGSLQSIKDASGIGWTFTSSTSGGVTTQSVTHTGGASFTVSTQMTVASHVMTKQVTVTDPAGNVYNYVRKHAFDPGAILTHPPFQLTSLSLPGLPATAIAFQYASPPTMTGSPILMTRMDYNGTPYFHATYDSSNRATGTRLADNTEAYSIIYTFPGGTGMTAAVTNPLGHTTTKNYGATIRGEFMLTSVNDAAVATCGATTKSYTYDSNGFLTKTVDNNGVSHTYSYAVNGQLQTETEASGTSLARKTDYVWDPNQHLNRLLSVAVAGDVKTTYAYDSRNRLASMNRVNLSSVGTANQSVGQTYAYTLYANGMVNTMKVTTSSPGGTAKVTYTYDSLGNLVSAVDGLGHATTWSGYNGLGQPGSVVGPNGDRIDFVWDARGRMASKTTHPNGGTAKWTYAYDGFGLPNKVTAPDGQIVTWTRNAVMRVTQITHNDKDGDSIQTFGYNANGDVTSYVVKRGSIVAVSVTRVYDGLGRIYQVNGANGQILTYAYDGNGNVLSVTDALGRKTRYAYDALNRATTVTDPANGVTALAYDKGDNVVKLTDPRGLVTTYSYDGLDLLWKQVSPDSGTTTFAYDAYGRLSSRTRADGVASAFSYDAMNRLTKVTAGGQSRTFTWDACTNGKGRLCTAATAASRVDYDYTPEGWVSARGITITSGPVYTVGFGYNATGQLTTVAYPDGNQANYDYSRGVATGVRLKVGSYNVNGVTGVIYRPMDLAMASWTSYNGLVNTIDYDSDLRPKSISVPGVQNMAFSYDTADRITTITNGMNSSHTQNLGYDVLDRLTSVASGVQTASYSYDADGNRTQQVLNGATTNFAYPATSNRLTGTSGAISASYGYNANGDTTTVNGLAAYNYDPFGRLANAGGAAFVVSAEDQRLRKSSGGDVTYFVPGVGGAPLAEQVNGTWRDYVWLNGRLVTVIANGGVYPVHSDQTGRPLALTHPTTGAVLWQALGLPFDRTVTGNAWGDFNLGFPGQYRDDEDDLWHNGYRDYDTTTGRYIQSDPIGLAGGVNTYAYVGNNPVSSSDPLGLVPASGAMADCLTQIFGESVTGVNVRNKRFVRNDWITTRKNSIRLPPDFPIETFFSSPHLVLHEYFHVLRQWNTGELSRRGYAAEFLRNGAAGGNRFEDAANAFADSNVDALKECLEEAKGCKK